MVYVSWNNKTLIKHDEKINKLKLANLFITKEDNVVQKDEQIEINTCVVENKETKQWFYRKKSEQFGPVNYEELRNLIKSGQIRFTTFIWTAGIKEWIEVEKVDGLTDGVNVEDIPPAFEPEEEYIKHKRITKEKKQSKPINKKTKTFGILLILFLSISASMYFIEVQVQDGTKSCSSCNGSGIIQVKCTNCGGDGEITSSKTCWKCNGKGRHFCEYSYSERITGGRGFLSFDYTDYYTCKGGKVYKNDYYYDVCSRCNGTAYQDCYTCGGDGKITKTTRCKSCTNGIVSEKDCDECNKSGQVPKFKTVKLYEKYVLPIFE